MKRDGIDRVSGWPFQPGRQPRVVLNDESVAEKTTFYEELLDLVPSPIHELVDRCFHCWNAHILMVSPATDNQLDMRRVSPVPTSH